MVVSFHPQIKTDLNFRLTPKRPFTREEIRSVEAARAVIVTQHVKADQYAALKQRCPTIFPDYTHRFGFEGKYGNVRLFRKFGAPHPETRLYESVADFQERHFVKKEPLQPFPLVLKGDLGGGGWAVFLAEDFDGLTRHLKALGNEHLHPTKRFVVQAFVPHGGADLRVVIVGGTVKSYWRCQNRPGEIRNNVGRGAAIVHDMAPELTKTGIRCVEDFCSKTGINLAAFDVLFDRTRKDARPLFSEVNFLFGRKGLGGSGAFHAVLKDAVNDWLLELPKTGT
jgi:ribosomal protein S6--L-glutamate ligase